MLRHSRWLEREEARRVVREDGTRFQEQDVPTFDAQDEDEDATDEDKARRSRVSVIQPLQPVDPEVLEYLARCPAEEWDEFEEHAKEEQVVVRAREDPDVFMEYCFRDKDGTDWKQQPFHRDMQALIPTVEETKLLIQGLEVMAHWPDGTPVRDADGIHLSKSLLTQIVVPREHAKTTQISVGRTIWEIGRNPRIRCKIVAATPKVAKEILFDISQNIELNLRVQRVFPDLKPDYKSGWSKTDIFVERGYDAGKDPTVSTKSVLGSGAGGRADWLLFDDVVDFRNAVGNPKLRPLVKKAIKSTFMPLMPPDGRVVYSATPWNDDDATNEFRTSAGWSVYWRPAIFEKRNRMGLKVKEVLWPGKYNLTVLSIRKMQMGPAEFSRQYLLQSVSDEDATFPESNLRNSFDYSRAAMGESIPREWARVGGMDLASSFRKTTGAFTVIFTGAIDPSDGRIYPIEIYRHQVGFTEAVEAVIERAKIHRWEILMVENNGYQQAMLSALEKERDQLGYGLQVEGFRTGNNKADPQLGLPGLSVVFSNGGFAIPYKELESHESSCECDLCTWMAELRGHPSARLSDTVMACWFMQRAAMKLSSTGAENYRVIISDTTAPVNNEALARDFADGGLVLDLAGSSYDRRIALEREMWHESEY